ncbi:hypothetical protein KFE25_003277 [Diacronema lutheri]|uniref:Aminoacyl-transfer RNA synthetases class-II family profile domain-containing protein n=2 Tax=Diacronema lutheri TaxID=2081491 RepID=A0A8J6C948_DIALT|nr:hypothetical protein KFE25_003277 [Diacronema lutheri]
MALNYGTGPVGMGLAMAEGDAPGGAASALASAPSRAPPPAAAPAADQATGFRTHTCGELRISDVGVDVVLAGWVQQARDMNHFAFVDLRDRYGITQCVCLNEKDGDAAAVARYELAKKLGREFVIQVKGKVVERSNKNKARATGEIEILAHELVVLNESLTPPFLIQDETDGGELKRMEYRYLDIRRAPIANALLLRNRIARLVREHLSGRGFVEIETPVLIKSTPEGARDFVVPSRMNGGQFYALPQSPQTFKQLLMVAGMDRYFQIVKCFRDEELRADRQPEFTQIDCEMSFVKQDDVLATFEGMARALFLAELGVAFPPFERMTWQRAMDEYGIDKPDLRFDMRLHEITHLVKGREFKLFDEAEYVCALALPGCAGWATKRVKDLEKMVTGEAVGASGLVWAKVKSLKPGAVDIDSSAKKFYDADALKGWADACGCAEGDLICCFWGPRLRTQTAAGKFRHLLGTELGLRSSGFSALWVVDFPLLEYDEEQNRYIAMHHPFTSCKPEDLPLMESDPGKVRANAYDMVINGVEVGGGSIRIHDKAMQSKVFALLGFTPEEAKAQFGFLLGAFEYGAPPHGGLAFGLDRLCTLIGGGSSIRDYIAFPKNNQGRDVMINAPSEISQAQLDELSISVKPTKPAGAAAS